MHNGVPLIADFCSDLTAGVVPIETAVRSPRAAALYQRVPEA